MIQSNPELVAPNKPALLLATAFGFALGLLPYLLLIDALPWLPLVAAVAAVGGYVALEKLESRSSFRPTRGEWLLGVWSAVGGAAAISLTGCLVYATGYWVVRGLTVAFGDDAPANPSTWAMWGSAALVTLTFITVPAEVAKGLAEKLYPAIPGTRSPFFALLANPVRLWLVAALTIGIVLASVIFLEPGGTALVVVLSAVLFYTSLPLSELGKDKPLDAADRRAGLSVRKLFESAGYKAIPSPTTGDAEVDPLLKEVDFLAQGGEHVLAVGVKRGAIGTKASEWSMASPLLSAANVLERRLAAGDGGSGLGVRPFLVQVGGAVGESLNTFAEREGVRLVHLPGDSAIEAVLGNRDPDALAERAAQILGVPRIHRRANQGSASA